MGCARGCVTRVILGEELHVAFIQRRCHCASSMRSDILARARSTQATSQVEKWSFRTESSLDRRDVEGIARARGKDEPTDQLVVDLSQTLGDQVAEQAQ